MSYATLFLLLFTAPAALADWQSRHQTGERLLREGKTEEARSELKTALEEAGMAGRGVVLDALGRAEFRAGHYREAKRHLEASLPLWPAHSRARALVLCNLGRVYLAVQNDARAEAVFRQALEILSGEPIALEGLGQAQFRRGRHREAEESFRKALSLAGRALAPFLASDLASLFEAKRQYAKAAEIWREAIAQADPGQARARMRANLAFMQWKRGGKGQAATQLRAALAEMEAAVGPRHPDVAKILEELQEVLRKTGRSAEAIAAAERAAGIRSSFARHTNDQRTTVDWRDLRR